MHTLHVCDCSSQAVDSVNAELSALNDSPISPSSSFDLLGFSFVSFRFHCKVLILVLLKNLYILLATLSPPTRVYINASSAFISILQFTSSVNQNYVCTYHESSIDLTKYQPLRIITIDQSVMDRNMSGPKFGSNWKRSNTIRISSNDQYLNQALICLPQRQSSLHFFHFLENFCVSVIHLEH